MSLAVGYLSGYFKVLFTRYACEKQRDTFFFFLDTLSNLLKESQDSAKLDNLEKDMNLALAHLERDFPVSKQVSIVFIHIVHIHYYNLSL